MKAQKLFAFLFAIAAICGIANAQTPNQFNFQGMARNSDGTAAANQDIKIRFTIHDSSGIGNILYKETRKATTDNNGLFAVVIGAKGGSSITGSLNNINWALYDKFLQTEIELEGATRFTNLGATQLLSVPYAEQARKADTTKFATYTTSLKTTITDATTFGGGDNITGGTTAVVSFANNNFSDTSFNSATHEYTVPSSGNYLIAFNINLTQFSNGGKTNGELAIRINGSNTSYTQLFRYPLNSDAATNNYPLAGTYIRYLTAGQKITIAVSNYGNSSDPLNAFLVSGKSLNIFKIGNR